MNRLIKRILIGLGIALPLLAIGIISGGLLMTQTTTPANPAAGHNKLYFKSDNKLYSLTSAGTEAEIGAGGGGTAYDPTDNTKVAFSEDFLSVTRQNATNAGWIIGQNVWQIGAFAGAGYSVSDVQEASAGEPTHPGQVELLTGTTSGAQVTFAIAPYSKYGSWLIPSRTGWKACSTFKLDGLTQRTLWMGVLREASAFTPNNFVGLYYDATSSGTNWFFRTERLSAGTDALYDTTVAADTNWHTFCVRGDDTTTGKLYMKLDSGAERSFCGSGCDTTASIFDDYGATWDFRLATKEAVTKGLYIDWVGIKATVTR